MSLVLIEADDYYSAGLLTVIFLCVQIESRNRRLPVSSKIKKEKVAERGSQVPTITRQLIQVRIKIRSKFPSSGPSN